MKCLLISFFNSHNLGDCMIAESLYNNVSKYYETEKYSYSGKSDIITDINNINKTNSNQKYSYRKKIYPILKKYKIDFLVSFLRKRDNKEIKSLRKKVEEVDLIVIGGGNMIFDIEETSNSAKKFNDIVSLAKEKNKTVFAIALGIGPFQNEKQEKEACDALKKCDYISFRDSKSFDIYEKHVKELNNVTISIDPVFFMEKQTSETKPEKKVIGFNLFNSKLIHESDENTSRKIKQYAILADELIEKLNINIILFSTDNSDYELINQVFSQINQKKRVEVQFINGLNDLITLYSKISLLIGMRMHSLIIAFTQFIPVIGLSWQPKVEAFFNIIESTTSVFDYEKIEESRNDLVNLSRIKLDGIKEEQKKMIDILEKIRLKGKNDELILEKLKQTLT